MIHRVVRGDYDLWEPIWKQIVEPNANCYIASNNRPTGTGGEDSPVEVPADKWAKVYTGINNSTNVDSLVNDVVSTLEANEAAITVFDELQSGNRDAMREIVERLKNYPNLNGRYGVYIVNGQSINYSYFKPVLAILMQTNGIIFPEIYFNYIDYCSASTSYKGRDDWMLNQINGKGSLNRFQYLTQLRNQIGSSSHIAPVIAVTDAFNDGATPFKMVDRAMWAFVNSEFGRPYSLLGLSHNPGAIGSWKWDTTGGTDILGRATEFVKSWNHYCRDKQKTPRKGTGYPVCEARANALGIRNTAFPPATSGADREFVTTVRSKPRLDRTIDKLEKRAGRAQMYRSTYKPTVGTIEKTPQKEDASVVDLYIHEINYGYAVEGEDHVSKYYSRFYPTSAVLRDVSVNGIARDEREYEDLTYWVRNVQSDIARGYVSYMGLRVPATGVNIWGYIPEFNVNIGGYGNPIPVGIQYQFQMVVIKDLTDPESKLANNVGSAIVGFYNESPYWKAQIADFSKDWYVNQALAQLKDTGKEIRNTSQSVANSITSSVSAGFFRGGNTPSTQNDTPSKSQAMDSAVQDWFSW